MIPLRDVIPSRTRPFITITLIVANALTHGTRAGLLNVAGYYDPLIRFLDEGVAARFIKPEHRAMILEDDDPRSMLERMRAYQPPLVEKWIRRDQT